MVTRSRRHADYLLGSAATRFYLSRGTEVVVSAYKHGGKVRYTGPVNPLNAPGRSVLYRIRVKLKNRKGA